jgi:heme a synthase
VALGAWVSTNHAVLACMDFPTCQKEWWPAMDFSKAYDIFHPLGVDAQGDPLSYAALTAIHMGHRLGALVLTLCLCALVWSLQHLPLEAVALATRKRWQWVLSGLLSVQIVSGVSNAVLGWPLFAALLHTAGAAALTIALTLLAFVLGVVSRPMIK